MSKTQITADPGVPLITISREFGAPRELVFRAHTEPDLLVRWLGPRDLTLTVDRYEVRDGGRWRYVHADADGSTYGFHGVFHGEPSAERITQTFEYEGAPGHVKLDTITFTPTSNGTFVETVFAFPSVADRDAMVAAGMERGVRDADERLDELLTSLPASSPYPGDLPDGRPASLDRLDALVGQWGVEATFDAGYFGPDSAKVTARDGRTTFEWAQGRFFLIQRFDVENPPAAPSGIAIIGAGPELGTFEQHYYDSRGVTRVYQMSLDNGIWRLWREAPGFWQRYTGRISDDGKTITGAWEKSADGREWSHDFGLIYIREG